MKKIKINAFISFVAVDRNTFPPPRYFCLAESSEAFEIWNWIKIQSPSLSLSLLRSFQQEEHSKINVGGGDSFKILPRSKEHCHFMNKQGLNHFKITISKQKFIQNWNKKKEIQGRRATFLDSHS